MSEPLRILLLDDDPADAELIARELERSGTSMDWRWVSSEADYLAALDTAIDVILSDYALPGFNAMAALQHLKQRRLDIPFIVVTGMLGDEAATDCIKQGATDYLLKDRLKRLGPAILRAVEDHRASAEHAQTQARLRSSEEAAARALRRANTRLERHVAERTRELTEANAELHRQIDERRKAEDQLHQAQKMEAIGQLTGGIAHDFNNLLTSILGSLDLAQRKEMGEAAARLVDRAMQAAERAAGLTSQLLAFGRRQALSASPIDLNRLIDDLQPMLKSTLTPAITIRTDLAADLSPAHADRTQVELALLNLAINARDAMPSGGVLGISTRNAADTAGRPADLPAGAADFVVLEVSDDGVGMTPEVAQRAFEPFFTTKAAGKGSGLGLSMVYGLAKQLGGTAVIQTEPGRGTRVIIYLPQATFAAVPHVETPVPIVARVRRHAAAVLVVDDEVCVRDMTAAGLREYGYDVIEAESGAAALQILDRGGEIGVLVTDFVMPGMHGSELAVAARLRRPSLPIILMTGYMGGLSTQRDVPDDLPVLHKPFRPAELAAMVAQCWDRPRVDTHSSGQASVGDG